MSTREPIRRGLPALGLCLLLALSSGFAWSQEQGSAPAQSRDLRPPAQLAVSPGKFEVRIDGKPTVQSARLLNMGDRDIEVRVSVTPWNLDDQGRVQLVESTETTIDQWIVFNPSTFTVPAHSEQTVRFSIRPRLRPEPGEHRAMIYFEEAPRPEQRAQVQVVFKLGVAVYAYSGEVEHRGTLEGIHVVSDDHVLRAGFDIQSEGNAHVRLAGQYAIWPLDAFPGVDALSEIEGMERPDFVPPAPVLLAGQLPASPVLAGTRREVMLAGGHSLPAGTYVLSALGTLGDRPVREAVEFVVPAPPAAGVTAQDRND